MYGGRPGAVGGPETPRGPAGAEAVLFQDKFPDLQFAHRVQADGGLVQEKDLGAVEQRGRVGNALKSLFAHDYTEVHALLNMSFSIPDGQIVGYIGPNGSVSRSRFP